MESKAQKKYRLSPKGQATRKRSNKRYYLKKRYGVTAEQFERMVNEQGGACAICGTIPTRRRLDVDHNHETGQVRGLLCMQCNTALGQFERYEKEFTKYLNKYKGTA